ncbi:hypothetical protein VPH35_077352 [Triticum aestivum]
MLPSKDRRLRPASSPAGPLDGWRRPATASHPSARPPPTAPTTTTTPPHDAVLAIFLPAATLDPAVTAFLVSDPAAVQPDLPPGVLHRTRAAVALVLRGRWRGRNTTSTPLPLPSPGLVDHPLASFCVTVEEHAVRRRQFGHCGSAARRRA